MNDVESLKIFLVFIRQHIVDLSEPRERRIVAAGGKRMEVGDNVVALHDRIQQCY